MINKEHLLAVADVLEATIDFMPINGKKIIFDMHHWNETNNCGTACCIGGLAGLMFETDGYSALGDNFKKDYPILEKLFYPDYHPAWNYAAHQAAMVIRHLVHTGEVDWELAATPEQRAAHLDNLAGDL